MSEPGDSTDSTRQASHPTGHPVDFDAMYQSTPPWDIGRPQRAFARLAETGALHGRVLDSGCGTGEHALLAAGLGLDVTGVDAAPAAIALATRKAQERGVAVRFVVGDALHLSRLGGTFDTVLDCGLFHIFDDDDRRRYVASLAAVIPPGGRYHMLCFSELQPGDWGPRRVRAEEIRSSFRDGWAVDSIDAAQLEITDAARSTLGVDPRGVSAWLASIRRS